MRYMSAIAGGAALLLGATAGIVGAASAQEPRMSEGFIRMCQSPNPDSQATCGAVVSALLDAALRIGEQDADARIICPPRQLQQEEARRVFLYWTEEQKDVAAFSFPELVIVALKDRYPCTSYRRR